MKSVATLAAIAALTTLVGCTKGESNNNNNQDGGNTNQNGCTPSTKECVSTQLARVCPSDGAGWLAVQCAVGTTCMSGDCVQNAPTDVDMANNTPVVICESGEKACTTDGKVATCNSAGTAFTNSDCPSGTTCGGAGLCVGSCIVGSSYCLGVGSVGVCNDGKTLTTTVCGANTACVQTSEDPFPVSACKPADCTPATNGCDLVCGNKADSSANQTKFLSLCQETPEGYKWLAIGCSGTDTCDPSGGGACGNGLEANAACTGGCTDGDSRCTDATHKQTCVAGVWQAETNCIGTNLSVCQQSGNQAFCAEPTCALGIGACTSSGQFRACTNGVLGATGVACATGSCVNDPPPVDNNGNPFTLPIPAGRCAVACQTGESQCAGGQDGSIQFQTCVNGSWGPAQACVDSVCFGTSLTGGLRGHVCGECRPGSHTCNDAGPSTDIRTCSASGTYGAFGTCPIGRCIIDDTGFVNDSYCRMECVPNQKYCSGNANTPWKMDGQTIGSAEGTCTAAGTRDGDTEVDCDGYCELTTGGISLGCVACAGKNEFGVPDSYCFEGSVNTCKADNSGFDAVACGDVSCSLPISPVPGAPAGTPYCHSFAQLGFNAGPFGLQATSNSALKLVTGLFNRGATQYGCAEIAAIDMFFFNGFPVPGGTVTCPSATGAPVADCCEFACVVDPPVTAAYCGPGAPEIPPYLDVLNDILGGIN